MAKSVRRKVVYVLSRELRTWCSTVKDSETLVRVDPITVYPGHDTGRIEAKREAKKLAESDSKQRGGEVAERVTNGKERYRVWNTPLSAPDTALFVYVVHEVEYVG